MFDFKIRESGTTEIPYYTLFTMTDAARAWVATRLHRHQEPNMSDGGIWIEVKDIRKVAEWIVEDGLTLDPVWGDPFGKPIEVEKVKGAKAAD